MQRQNIIKQLSNEQIEAIKQDKIRKVYKYLEYSKQMGTVDS